MLNVTIQNDGKIKIQTECSNIKEMRHNVNLLLAVVSSMEMEEATANKEANGVSEQTIYYLYLNKVESNNKVNTVKVLKDQLNVSLEKARAVVNTATYGTRENILLSQSHDKNFINTVKDALESVGCICEITKGQNNYDQYCN